MQIGIKDSSTLEAARKKAPKRVAKANPILHYYSLVLACKFSGDPPKKNRIRKTKWFCQGCPFLIKIGLSVDGKHLVVNEFNDQHNDHLQRAL